jgi:hypothetical protein
MNRMRQTILEPKYMKLIILGLFLSLIFLPPLHAQAAASPRADTNPTTANAVPTGQAPDEVMKKLSDMVHARRYADAQHLITGLLVVYPDDQRLIKAKALLDKSLGSPTAADPAASSNSPASNVPSFQLGANVNPPQLNPTPKPAVPEAQSSTSMGNPTPETAVLPVYSSAPIDNPAPVSATPSSVPNTTILHVYRLKRLSGTGFNIFIDGDKITAIANGQAIRMLLAAGKHTVSVSNNRINDKVPINDLPMVAGGEYWIRVDFITGFSTLIPYVKLSLVPADQARSESMKLEEMRIGDLSKN